MQIGFNISNFFKNGHSRTVEAKKNVAGNIVIKAFSMFISFIIVPITINYINPTQYGIWLTLTSMISWVSLLDVGLTQGLRNKFAEAKAKNDDELAKIYVSTTYFYITILFVGVWVLLYLVNNFIDWNTLINIPIVLNKEVKMLASIIITYFCLQFIFQIIKTIIIADQKPAIAALIDLIGQVVSLLIIYIFTLVTNGSLILLGIAIGVFPVLFLIIANIYFFSTDYKPFKPEIKFVKNQYRNELMGLGLKFFILQLAGMIQYGSSLFLIARYFDTSEVTSYNIAFKYFMTLQGIFLIFLAPLWSSSTDAYFKGDFNWIISIVKSYLLILLPFLGLGIIMLIYANKFYDFWLGEGIVDISFKVSLYSFIFFAVGMFASIFVNVINGIGALKIQFYSSLVTSIGFILLALFFIKFLNLPVWSIILASIISNVYGYLLAPIQLYHILVVRKLNSIWFK
ncbi:oligosaccharide flippase family protein [Algoriphagus sp. C2-6-M1]|uniref:lipopolysaccharide biosynthesis protein n=1 Tax=Algoriphagus persicinus TaxID=3108754 RepID=UPI002B371333|nr:oligosaccharide flippase family protein [Algoriphagus sp. C2-6-M1]MEB2782620.1 oligosaccharide flippase family protein [Algoriphagus sp. C2-6-M1]